MLKKIITSVLLTLLFLGHLSAHSGKPKYHVVIDTDGAVDDMRSIAMFLSGNDIRVLAFTCSQGTLMPDMVFVKVSSLLEQFHHQGIPVGIGQKIDFKLPVWSSFAQNIQWGADIYSQGSANAKTSNALLNKIIGNYRNKVTLIALGSLKTYADLIKRNPEIIKKIDRIVWYNNHTIKDGFNYQVSPESYEFIQKSGITLEIVANKSNKLLVDANYLDEIKNANSVYANQIIQVHSQKAVAEKIKARHLHLWDDIVPLYLTVPLLFDVEIKDSIKYVSMNEAMPDGSINEIIHQLLISSVTTNNRVFKSFPTDTELYKPAYAKMLAETIKEFGIVEWKAIAMTNEIHGHTGIYSIIGAKMGIRAMEYFNVGINNLEVTTYAGNKPPLSCFNDGIQISTGATIGQGLITISDSVSSIPSATFIFNNQKVNISVKPEIAKQMQNEIKYGVKTYGLLTDKYWLYIEELAIKYWTKFDRHEIFIII